MANSSRFMANTDCKYYKSCHENLPEKNCLFCYCPLFAVPDCGGNFKILYNGWKDCSACLFPHIRENYDKVVEKLIAFHSKFN